MHRQRLLDDVRVLTSLLARANEHERRVHEADERDDHIQLQIDRLEEAALKIERRMIELDAADDGPEAELFAEERRDLQKRLEVVQNKTSALRRTAMENEFLDLSAHAARAPGVPARLRRTLFELVADMHSDPEIPKADIRPFQARLAELVRDRRQDLVRIADRIQDGRDYVTSAASTVREISLAEIDAAGGLPYAEERRLAATRVEMARVALEDAVAMLASLAHDWPELQPLASRPDWKKLPIAQLADLLAPRDEEAAARQMPFGARIREAAQLAAALALWLEELRRAVLDAPAPV